MKTDYRRSDADHEEHLPAWIGVGKFLLLAFFTVMLYLLGQSMVRHHFFSGGSLNYRMSSPQQ